MNNRTLLNTIYNHIREGIHAIMTTANLSQSTTKDPISTARKKHITQQLAQNIPTTPSIQRTFTITQQAIQNAITTTNALISISTALGVNPSLKQLHTTLKPHYANTHHQLTQTFTIIKHHTNKLNHTFKQQQTILMTPSLKQ